MTNESYAITTLHPSKIKYLLFLLLLIGFEFVGILMVLDNAPFGWYCVIIFGLGIPIFVVNLFPQAAYLKLDEKGFEVCSLFRKRNYLWKDITHFRAMQISNNKVVMFNYTIDYKKDHPTGKLSSLLTGADGGLPDTYGMKAEELAAILNDYRNNYSQRAEINPILTS